MSIVAVVLTLVGMLIASQSKERGWREAAEQAREAEQEREAMINTWLPALSF